MIRLLLVDDQTLICHGLTAMLERQPDLQVVGIANDGETAIKQVANLHPNLVLMMDLRLPSIDGKEATRAICQKYPETKVLVLSMFDDDQFITDSVKAGAIGYLLKDIPLDELVQAIRLATNGYTQLAPGLMQKLMNGIPDSSAGFAGAIAQELPHLTSREQEVLDLLGVGATNREIAEQLYISEGTVKTHVTRLLTRLNLRNRAQLAVCSSSMRTNIKANWSLTFADN